jgi:hypothetical protein
MEQDKNEVEDSSPKLSAPTLKENDIELKAESPPVKESTQLPDKAAPPQFILPDVQTSTVPMEVHHHGHVHNKTKWKEYAFQFFMLFLAVFCGFLAEYQLEHVIENNREKQFMRSLLADLSDDQAEITRIQNRQDERGPMMDSLIRLLNSDGVWQHTADVYYFGRLASRGTVLPYNNRTIDQMRNSGGFRLVRKENVANSIMEYYSALGEVKMLEQTDLDEQNQYRALAVKVFNGEVFQSIVTSESRVLRPQGNPPLRTYDKALLGDLASWVHYMNNTRISICSELKPIKQKGLDLSNLIKKEYHLD